jgi:hypothetical protein
VNTEALDWRLQRRRLQDSQGDRSVDEGHSDYSTTNLTVQRRHHFGQLRHRRRRHSDVRNSGGSPLHAYKFVGMFPTNLSAIDLDWEPPTSSKVHHQFDYQWWEAVDASTGADHLSKTLIGREA